MKEALMQGNSPPEPLTFGFDIGIASVGWAVLSPTRIVDLGVRCFDKAETAKEGESLNLARRSARLMRRRLYRRAWRLTKLAKLLKRSGLIADTKVLKQQPDKGFKTPNLWQLRVDALERQLTAEEWARVIYHLCKHRGFHWISRAEEKQAEGDSKSEGGKVKQGLNATAKLMQNYRTAAEMVLTEFPDAQRNKHGDYGKALSRKLLADELHKLFENQRTLGNPFSTPQLQLAVLGTGDRKSGFFWEQKPPLSGANLLKMLGKCTFEKAEFRAPKASFTAERHVWLTRLNNLRIITDGTTRPLTEAERQIALPLPYSLGTDLSYKQLGAALVKAGLLEKDQFKFAGLSYPSAKQLEEKEKNPETATLTKLPAYQALRKLLEKRGLSTEWEAMKSAALDGRPEQLDQIAWALSVYKEDDEVSAELRKLALPNAEKMIDSLLDIRFDKFHALSLKALRKIVPRMERGLRYDDACEQAGYHHSQIFKTGEGEHRYLPPLYSGRDKSGRMLFDENMDIPRNPVVLRALNQARKVCNALIRKHGSPHAVHIEMARDLSRPMDERNKVKKLQEEFRDRNKRDREIFAADYDMDAKSREFERYQLYREQQCKCAYSLEPLDLHRVLHEQGYAEVDHALPYSRSFDDSKNNKVLALTRENRNKGNRTPYEFLDGANNSERWRLFVASVEGNKLYRQAKRSRLLRKDFSKKEAEEFKERNLNDTRYICKFFKNYVEQYLQLAESSNNKRCVVVSGQLTAFLRARWGLLKVRGESDRHHALDAVVVAACSHGMVNRLSNYSRRKVLEHAREGFVDIETGEIVNPAMLAQLEQHFPEPWAYFRNELTTRLKTDDVERLREDLQQLGTYPEDQLKSVKPIFVSRAPQRRNGGAAHKDTIYAQPVNLKEQGGVTQKVSLASLTLKDMDKLIDPHRNEKLYAAIRARLEEHGGKGDKAFTSEKPLYKPDKDGNPTGPIVRTVTTVIDRLSGIPVRGGVAKNDSMLRIDLFIKAGRFYLVPVYVHHSVAKELPNRAIIQGRDEADWTLIDDSFEFCFSIHPNDLIKIKLKNAITQGYYAGCDRSTGAISLWAHDRNEAVGKDGLIRSIGVKTAISAEKFNVDVLGNIYPAPKEQRRDLA
jgi:CRISPR-associated endonuclease Csn1